MNDLMIHVERIVRPVRASQSRKLRMRCELLAHLEAALDEERRRFPDDEPAAIDHAKHRLGDPAELTKTLQQTVPFVERALLARMPVSPRVDQWEARAARSFYGIRGVMTMTHTAILAGMAALIAGVPLYIPLRDVLARSGPPAVPVTILVLGSSIGWLLLLLASGHFVFSAAGAGESVHWPSTAAWVAIVVVSQLSMGWFTTLAAADQSASLGELAACAATSIGLLTVSVFVARRVAVRRRLYDPWLTLDLAD